MSEHDPHSDPHSEAFERELAVALRHVDAPPNFTLRVLEGAGLTEAKPAAKAAAKSGIWRPRDPFAWMRVQRWAGAAVAAALAIGVLAGEHVHDSRNRERANANQQFEAATRITDQALEHTREQLRQAGVPGVD